MKARLLLLIVNILALGVYAQPDVHFTGSLYDALKTRLNENSLPLVNITVDVANLHRTSFVPGEIEITDWHRRTDPDKLTVKYNCMYRIRGGTSTALDKKSFAVKLVDDNGKDLNVSLFGIREENSWILDAMAIDRTRMRNRVCFDVWNELSRTPYDTDFNGRNGTEGVFVEVFINKEYNGLYCLSDKVDRKLLDLKKAQVDEEGNVTTRGLLYKGNSWGDYTDIWLLGYKEADTSSKVWNAWELQYPDDYPSEDTWQPLMDLINYCSEPMTDEEFMKTYQDWFYPDNLADYALFTMALNVGDNAYKNTFLSVKNIEKGHCFLLTPWDMDMSLGGNWNGGYNEALANIKRYDGVAPYNRLIGHYSKEFIDMMGCKWEEYAETLFSCEEIERRLNHYAEMFTTSGAWEREYDKWNGNPVPLSDDIADELDYVKDWYERNHERLGEQLGTVTTTGSFNDLPKRQGSDKVYTLDGRRVSVLRKGIYIDGNGRKVVIR